MGTSTRKIGIHTIRNFKTAKPHCFKMNLVLSLQAVVFLVVASTILGVGTNLTDTDAIIEYLKKQSNIAIGNFDSLTVGEIQVGDQAIQTAKDSNKARFLNNEIALIFNKDGSISTYNKAGESKQLVTRGAGEFHIDEEIFGLVFPGFSMDTKGNNTNNTTESGENAELKMTTKATKTQTTTVSHKNSAVNLKSSSCTLLFFTFIGVSKFSL